MFSYCRAVSVPCLEARRHVVVVTCAVMEFKGGCCLSIFAAASTSSRLRRHVFDTAARFDVLDLSHAAPSDNVCSKICDLVLRNRATLPAIRDLRHLLYVASRLSIQPTRVVLNHKPRHWFCESFCTSFATPSPSSASASTASAT